MCVGTQSLHEDSQVVGCIAGAMHQPVRGKTKVNGPQNLDQIPKNVVALAYLAERSARESARVRERERARETASERASERGGGGGRERESACERLYYGPARAVVGFRA